MTRQASAAVAECGQGSMFHQVEVKESYIASESVFEMLSYYKSQFRGHINMNNVCFAV